MAGRRALCANTVGIGVQRDGAFAEFIVMPAGNLWPHLTRIDLDVAAHRGRARGDRHVEHAAGAGTDVLDREAPLGLAGEPDGLGRRPRRRADPIVEQRLDETEVGEGTTITLITMKRPAEFKETGNPADCAQLMGLDPRADGILEWDLLDAVLTPGDLILLISWHDHAAAERFEDEFTVPDGARLRRVRVVRDYSMFDRREAPQYYADAKGRESIHA